jgi:ribosomal protein S18 acetylase RimI-like enzyme
LAHTVITPATIADIPQLVELLSQLFSIEKDFQPDRERQVRGLHLLISEPERGIIMVARNEEGKAVGMVSAQLVISTAQGAPSAWVEDMVISPEYRGAGTGKALLQSALDWAKEKGATRAQLLVDMENDPAIGYYRHLGWETTQLQARRIFFS